MMYQELIQKRKAKGYEIAKTNKVIQKDGKWFVPSQNNPHKIYEVVFKIDGATCTCEDHKERGIRCKHIFGVEFTITKQINQDGTTIITTTKKITYAQDWKAYDLATTQQKELFMKLLFELCENVHEEQKQVGKGRPRLPLRDMVFSSGLKVFTTFSLRRFTTDMREAQRLDYIQNVPHYSSVALYMESKELTPILMELITLSSMPLKSVETKFAVDSSGFRTTKFNEYCRTKYNATREHNWIKAHICCGVKTNIITAVEIDSGYSADVNKFVPLVEITHNNGFNMQEVSADKAYSSRNNLGFVGSIGGMPFIPFKSNTTGKRRGDGGHVWKRMYNFFTYRREEFLEHYHNRSNVESTFNMIKTKFTDLVRSRNEIAQVNEVLLKVLCHNICVVIQETYELGIEPNFLD